MHTFAYPVPVPPLESSYCLDLLDCGHHPDYLTPYLSPVFGRINLCTLCGEVQEGLDDEYACSFSDSHLEWGCDCPDGDAWCNDLQRDRLHVYGGRHAGPRRSDGLRRRPGRRGASALGAGRRCASAVAAAVLVPVGLWRW